MRFALYITLLLLSLNVACSTKPRPADPNTVTIDRPVIKDLSTVEPGLQKLKHSSVRLRVKNHDDESFGTGFFFRSRDLLVTTQHIFSDKHECLQKLECDIVLGFAKDSKDVIEQTVAVEVVLKYPTKDLIFLKIKDDSKLTDIAPLQNPTSQKDGTLTAIGFYQDNPSLTFSQGKNLDNSGERTQTSIIVSAGFSGSPVINSRGELVGVVSSYKPIKGQHIGLAQFISMDDLSK